MRLRNWTAAALLSAVAGVALAGEAPKKPAPPKKPPAPAYLTPEQAGPDFLLQGEYAGKSAKGDLGVQVIAQGNGKFHAVAFIGGLPGAGWDGKTKYELDGALQGQTVTFTGRNVEPLTLSGGKIKAGDAELAKVLRKSSTEGATPPAGAIVLFDGTNTDAWTKGKMDDRKLLSVQVGGGTATKQHFKDFTLHLEFLLPFMPTAGGQGRANSGVYPQGRYEVQVLDSFGLKGVDNECGGVYKNAAPAVNMCFPPLSWQTYDIDFTSAKFDGDKKVVNAVITVKHNGVVIHDKLQLSGPTPGGPQSDAKKFPESTPGPIYLQDHGNPVFFRNIWIVEKK